MTLLAPLMMLGAAAITVPIALHFFYRARYKPLPWAPMKFLKEAIEQTSRRLKFQEWLLLLLRCLALILLALAIARPGWENVSSAGSSETIDAVFVFDTSYSMSARDGEKTRLERAKDAAIAVLETLPNKSSVQVYSCSDRANLLGPVSRYNRDQAKQLIQSLEVSSLSTDFLPGLNEALAAAETGTAPAKEIYVFSDMQKVGFERQQGAVRAKCEEIKAKANLVFIRCGNPERKISNVSVIDVKLLAAIPHTRTRVPFVVTVRNTGREQIRNVKVSLELDGKAVENVVSVEQIDPGANAEVTLTGSLDEAGSRLLAVYVDGDGIEGDNVLYKIVGVREKVRVLLVAYPFAGLPATDAGDWFARKALVPFDAERDKDKIEKYFIDTESILPHEVGPDKLAGKDIVYLLNAQARTDDPLTGLSPAFVKKLTEFVKHGGGLVIGCGDRVQADAYNRVLGGEGLLPIPLRPAPNEHWNTTDATPFVTAGESIDENSVFGQVKPYTDWLRRATCTRLVQLDETAPGAAGSRVLVRTTDGKPLVTSRVFGEGEVIFFATALDEAWGSRMMSDGQLAIPMTTYIVAHLTGRKVPGGTRMAGDTLTWFPNVTAPGFELVKPRPRGAKPGEKVRPRVKIGEAKAEAGQKPSVSTNDSLVAGEYAIVPIGAPEIDGITFAVNPDLRETENLDVISDGDLEKLLGFRPTIIQAGAGTETAVRDRRTKGEWTEWVLLFLLFLLIVEATWAWSCGRAK